MQQLTYPFIEILLLALLLIISGIIFPNTNKVVFWKSIIAIIFFTIILIKSIIFKSFNDSTVISISLYLVVVSYLITRVIKSYKLMQ